MLQVSGLRVPQLGIPIATIFLLGSLTAWGQSLGDVARESREKQAEAAATVPKKVITNLDSAQAPEEAEASSAVQTPPPRKISGGGPTPTTPVDLRTAEQWRRQILAQKRTVATLEKRLARFKAAISYGDASAIARGEILTRNQALEQERLARAQEQLDEQKARLLEMQEEARQAGMYPKVYDP